MKLKRKNEFCVGRFNVRGLVQTDKQFNLKNDMDKYKMDIICLQETKIIKGIDTNIDNHRLISLPTTCRSYGNGFMISPKWKDNVYKYCKVSDRI